ncbi:MAG: NAD-binding protein, partial [Mariprofundaceae bacterium]|nr:NAD-binding protein [Mariprofundaceae bacterium]
MTFQNKSRATDTFRFLLLQRIRIPLIVLIVSFSVSVLGFVLIPGIDPDGNTWHMDFFHAYYFTSYMATTIGFGELPYPFTDAQRLWTIISIYITVGAWLYGFGTIISLVQDHTFRAVLKEASFSRHIRKMREPFYIICGYGDAGSLLLHSLTECGHHVVVLDGDQERINALSLENHSIYVPGMAVDAGNSEQLNTAGLKHPMCAGVAAITGSDQTNLKIAIAVKLLNPKLNVVCRAETQGIADNMNSFGTDCIVTPFMNYAKLFSMAIHSPVKSQLYDWLYGTPRTALAAKMEPPSGYWIICGYSRMGKAIYHLMSEAGLECKVIVRRADLAPAGSIAGRGTEAHTLEEAD